MSLITIFLTILAAMAVLGPLIALHEWGHYIVARLCGVKVITYSIGFGKELWSWTSPKTGIKYCISALPLGGFVKMLDGREGEVSEDEKHLAFDTQHPLKKIAIVVAGPVMNFLIAIILFWVLFITPSEQFNTRIGSVIPDSYAAAAGIQVGDKVIAIDDNPIDGLEEMSYKLADRMGETATIKITVEPYVANEKVATANTVSKDYLLAVDDFMQGKDKGKSTLEVLGINRWQPNISPIVIEQLVEKGAAERQGMLVGDTIVAINDKPLKDWFEFQRIVRKNPQQSLDIEVLRMVDGTETTVTLDVMLQSHKDSSGNVSGMIGIAPKVPKYTVPAEYQHTVAYDPLAALNKSVEKTVDLSYMTLKSMGKMLVGIIGLENLSGPISIAQVAKQSFDISWEVVLSTAGLISVSLAVLNLLPIPVLDGGHLLFYLIELIRGKPLSDKTQIIAFNIGAVVMLSLMLLAIGMDITRFL